MICLGFTILQYCPIKAPPPSPLICPLGGHEHQVLMHFSLTVLNPHRGETNTEHKLEDFVALFNVYAVQTVHIRHSVITRAMTSFLVYGIEMWNRNYFCGAAKAPGFKLFGSWNCCWLKKILTFVKGFKNIFSGINKMVNLS